MYDGEQLDATLRGRTSDEQRIAESLLELDNHPGHRLLTQGRLTGVTAARWANGQPALAQLWQDYTRYRDTLAAARAARGNRARPNADRLAELHRLLTEPSIELERTEVPLPERGLTGAAQRVELVTLEQLSARMHATFDQVSALVTDCAARREETLAALAPIAERLRATRRLASELAAPCPELDPVATALTELERRASTDPLSLPGARAQLSPELAGALDATTARLAELAEVRDGWTARLAELDAQLAELGVLGERERAARRQALELTDAAAGLVEPPDPLPALRTRRAALDRSGGWADRAVALRRVRVELAEAAGALRAAEALATGLVERRAELRGRFQAYRARAARLGRVEEDALAGLEQRILRMLWTRPAQLAAATRALAEYQRLLRSGPADGAAGGAESGRPV